MAGKAARVAPSAPCRTTCTGSTLIGVREARRAGNVRGAESDDEVVLPVL